MAPVQGRKILSHSSNRSDYGGWYCSLLFHPNYQYDIECRTFSKYIMTRQTITNYRSNRRFSSVPWQGHSAVQAVRVCQNKKISIYAGGRRYIIDRCILSLEQLLFWKNTWSLAYVSLPKFNPCSWWPKKSVKYYYCYWIRMLYQGHSGLGHFQDILDLTSGKNTKIKSLLLVILKHWSSGLFSEFHPPLLLLLPRYRNLGN